MSLTVECGSPAYRDIVSWPLTVTGSHPHSPESRHSHHDHHHQHCGMQTRIAQQEAEISTLSARVHHIQTAVGRLITADED